MPLRRTPPTTPQTAVQHSTSSPNVNITATDPVTDFVNTSKRSTKRLCSESSPKNDLSEFKEEIRALLTKWNREQETTLKNFMSKITLDLADLKSQHENLQRVKADIEESANLMNFQYEEIRSRIISLEKERSEQCTYINKLECKIQDLQAYQRSAFIELRNIPIKEKEVANDLVKLITNAGKLLQVQIEPAQIRDVYRTQSKQGLSKQVVAELHSITQKNQLLQAARDFNKGKPRSQKLNSELLGVPGECVPIYISDRLPLSLRQLFYETRKFASANDFNYCWTSNGKIFLKKREGDKPIRIISNKNFLELLQK